MVYECVFYPEKLAAMAQAFDEVMPSLSDIADPLVVARYIVRLAEQGAYDSELARLTAQWFVRRRPKVRVLSDRTYPQNLFLRQSDDVGAPLIDKLPHRGQNAA